MSQPAPVTDPRDWADMVAAAYYTASRIDDLRNWIAALRDPDRNPDRDTEHDAAERGLDAEQEQQRLDRLDYETDLDLDGDYDLDPRDEPDLDPT